MPVILLADNGSTRAAATLELRKLADTLGQKTGQQIHPVSFQHADKIPHTEIEGIPAQTFYSFMQQQLGKGEREFILLPLFFGQSRALTSFIPEQVKLLQHEFGEFSLKVADVIYPLPSGEPLLAEIIYEHIMNTAEQQDIELNNIVLVDHGSPIPAVTEVRKHLCQSVQQRMEPHIELAEAVMERRPGKEYDFNGDLLENWLLEKARLGAKNALVVLVFFLPGRHAGDGGDIIEICESVMKKHPDFYVSISPLISEHPLLINILADRLNTNLNG